MEFVYGQDEKFEVDLWTFERCRYCCRLGAIPAHDMTFPTYKDTVIVNGENILF